MAKVWICPECGNDRFFNEVEGARCCQCGNVVAIDDLFDALAGGKRARATIKQLEIGLNKNV